MGLGPPSERQFVDLRRPTCRSGSMTRFRRGWWHLQRDIGPRSLRGPRLNVMFRDAARHADPVQRGPDAICCGGCSLARNPALTSARLNSPIARPLCFELPGHAFDEGRSGPAGNEVQESLVEEEPDRPEGRSVAAIQDDLALRD